MTEAFLKPVFDSIHFKEEATTKKGQLKKQYLRQKHFTTLSTFCFLPPVYLIFPTPEPTKRKMVEGLHQPRLSYLLPLLCLEVSRGKIPKN